MREDMREIFEINEKVKRIAAILPIVVPVPEHIKEEIRKNIEEAMRLVKIAEKSVLWKHTSQEIYIIGKIFGRMEMIYSLIAREVMNVREKE
jgi:hypothetical protein